MPLQLSVLTIGDELLNGEMADTNTAAIARRLEARGFRVRDSLCVRDQEDDIVAALRFLSDSRDVVIVTGGLGPTADDLTAQAASAAFGRPLESNAEALAQIHRHFARLGLAMHPRNEKQARLPQGVAILSNPTGTAPGFRLEHTGCTLFFLPGVPAEMTAMLEQSVLATLVAQTQPTALLQERVLKVFGLSEPKTEARLDVLGLPKDIQIAFGVDFPFVHVKLRASGENAEVRLDQAERLVRQGLGEFVCAAGSESLAETVARQLTEAGLTLALAESCTGGMIAKQLTDVPGASAFLERSAVTYANSAKHDWLNVSDDILTEKGAVSPECAQAMARGIRSAADADLGMAVTGIAGPTGGAPGKPVGTVFIALADRNSERVKGYRFAGDRATVRTLTSCMALDWLRRHLESETGGDSPDK